MISAVWNWLGRLAWKDGGSAIQTGGERSDLQCKQRQPVALETHKIRENTPRAPVPRLQGIPDFCFRNSSQDRQTRSQAIERVQQDSCKIRIKLFSQMNRFRIPRGFPNQDIKNASPLLIQAPPRLSSPPHLFVEIPSFHPRSSLHWVLSPWTPGALAVFMALLSLGVQLTQLPLQVTEWGDDPQSERVGGSVVLTLRKTSDVYSSTLGSGWLWLSGFTFLNSTFPIPKARYRIVWSLVSIRTDAWVAFPMSLALQPLLTSRQFCTEAHEKVAVLLYTPCSSLSRSILRTNPAIFKLVKWLFRWR